MRFDRIRKLFALAALLAAQVVICQMEHLDGSLLRTDVHNLFKYFSAEFQCISLL